MSNRITTMRQSLVDELKKLGNPHDWSHVVKQQGMFAYTVKKAIYFFNMLGLDC